MKQSKVLLVFAIIITIVLAILQPVTMADNTKYLYIVQNRNGKGSYQIAMGGQNRDIFKIVEVINNGTSYDNNIYCIHGGPGFGGTSDTATERNPAEYTKRSNFKNVSDTRAQATSGIPTDTVVNNIEITTDGTNYTAPSYSSYNAVLWILDNMYIPKINDANLTSTEKTKLITQMKENLLKNAFKGTIYENATDIITSVDLSDEDIEVVQQLAIWHFTNTNTSGTVQYGMYDVVSYINGTGSNKKIKYKYGPTDETDPEATQSAPVIDIGTININETSIDGTRIGKKQANAQTLFTYLVHNAMLQSNVYGTGNNRDITDSAVPISFETLSAETSTSGTKTLIGPFKIKENTKVANIPYIIGKPEIVNSNGETQNIDYSIYTITNGTKSLVGAKSAIDDTKMKALLGKEFYVEINSGIDLTGMSLSVTPTYIARTADFWMEKNKSGGAAQPVVIVDGAKKAPLVKRPINQTNFDLALRKFITAVTSNGTTTQITNRIPHPNYNETYQRFIYEHPKYDSPVTVKLGDIVTYTLRIYNEGDIDGYAQMIVDDIPDGLTYFGPKVSGTDNYNTLTDTEKAVYNFNNNNSWKLASDGKVQTDNLSRANGIRTNLIEAFDIDTMKTTGPNYKDVQIQFVVTKPKADLLINTAEIAEDADSNGNDVVDIDSTPGRNGAGANPIGSTGYYRFNFTEDDIDKEYLKVQVFDLALRKFITAVNNVQLTTTVDGTTKYTREPQAQIGADGKITYVHPKNPVAVQSGNIVTYTIRVYNEGDIDGYAEEITDYLPEGTRFLVDNQTNIDYLWKLDPTDTTGRTIKTDFLAIASKNRTSGDKLLQAFDGTTLHYQDIKIAVEVTEPNDSDKEYLENIAEISDDKDSQGNDITDVDSIPNNKNDETRRTDGSFNEDDTDFERIKLSTFDMALRKFITEVNGTAVETSRAPVPTYDETKKRFIYKHPKDELPVKVANGDIVTYTLRIYNEGSMDGYASIVMDDIPEGLQFVEDNQTNIDYGWEKSYSGDTIITSYLADKLISKFDKTTMMESGPQYRDIKVAFKVTEPNNSTRKIANTAEIAEEKDTNGNSTTDETLKDVDSTPGNGNLEGKDEFHNFKEDDIDKDYIVLNQFDMALRKFITEVNGTAVKTNRAPVPEYNDARGRFIYKHPKNEAPVPVSNGDLVTYTIRVYNEGDIDGYVQEIVDDIPEGLEFVENNDTNQMYGWKKSTDGKSITTDYLSKEKAVGNVIEKFVMSTMRTTGPNYKDVKVVMKVTEPNGSSKMIDNTAEITDEADTAGNKTSTNTLTDIDSTPGDGKLDGKDEFHNFKQDDIDKDYIILQQFDLALRKFITKVNAQDITTRIPQPTMSETGRIIYIHPKNPITVVNGSIVVYTLRIYNEGTVAGYAQSIVDDIPAGLEFLPDNAVNQQFGWKKTEDGKITTDYLSREKALDNLIPAFDRTTMQTPAYKDVQVAFRVTGQNLPTDRILINTAEIQKHADKDGNDIKDVDSTPGNGNEEGKDENHNFKEDDIDKEYLKVEYFDLALLKWVNKVIVTVDGNTTERETGHQAVRGEEEVVKQEIKKNKLNQTTVKFEYTIRVMNEGTIAGYAKEVSDYIPEGLKFVAEDNPGWSEVDGKVVTRALENTLLQPGESAEVKVILTWINNANNMGVKVNVAEISEDYNDYNAPDIDSTPNNVVPGEDDIDDAPVALSISTGGGTVIWFGVIAASLLIVIGGVVIIKKVYKM